VPGFFCSLGFPGLIYTHVVGSGMNNFSVDSDCSVGLEFYDFLKESEHTIIRLDGFNNSSDSWCTSYISGTHRWKDSYKKRIYAKIHALDAWYVKHHSPIAMVTFTTFQKGIEKPDQIDLLKHSFNKAKKLLNKYLGKFPYIWVMECHESGYSHIHMVVFKNISRSLREKISKIWTGKYSAGGFKDAVQFKISKPQRSLRSAAAYVFAYIVKTLDYEALNTVNSGYYIQSSWVWKMSRRDTDYTGVRLWSSSRDLTEAMKNTDECLDSNIIWWRVSWKVPNGGWFPLWIDSDMSDYPDRVEAFDLLLSQDQIPIYKPSGGGAVV